MGDFNCKLALGKNKTVVYTSANGVSNPRVNIALDELTEELLARFNVWLGDKDRHCDRADLALLGRFLYKVLLPSDRRPWFKISRFTPIRNSRL